MKPARFIPQFVATFLILTLSLSGPSFALRSSIERKVESGLEESLDGKLREGLAALQVPGKWMEEANHSRVLTDSMILEAAPFSSESIFEGRPVAGDAEQGMVYGPGAPPKKAGQPYRSFVSSSDRQPKGRTVHFHLHNEANRATKTGPGVLLQLDEEGRVNFPLWLERDPAPFAHSVRERRLMTTLLPFRRDELPSWFLEKAQDALGQVLGPQWQTVLLHTQPSKKVFVLEPLLGDPEDPENKDWGIFLEQIRRSPGLQKAVRDQDWEHDGIEVHFTSPASLYGFPLIATGRLRRMADLSKQWFWRSPGEDALAVTEYRRLLQHNSDFRQDYGPFLFVDEHNEPIAFYLHGFLMVKAGTSFEGRGDLLEKIFLWGAELSKVPRTLPSAQVRSWPPAGSGLEEQNLSAPSVETYFELIREKGPGSPKVVILVPVGDSVRKALEQLDATVYLIRPEKEPLAMLPPEQLRRLVGAINPHYIGVFVNEKLDAQLLSPDVTPHLKGIAHMGLGYGNIDTRAAADRGLLVSFAGGGPDNVLRRPTTEMAEALFFTAWFDLMRWLKPTKAGSSELVLEEVLRDHLERYPEDSITVADLLWGQLYRQMRRVDEGIDFVRKEETDDEPTFRGCGNGPFRSIPSDQLAWDPDGVGIRTKLGMIGSKTFLERWISLAKAHGVAQLSYSGERFTQEQERKWGLTYIEDPDLLASQVDYLLRAPNGAVLSDGVVNELNERRNKQWLVDPRRFVVGDEPLSEFTELLRDRALGRQRIGFLGGTGSVGGTCLEFLRPLGAEMVVLRHENSSRPEKYDALERSGVSVANRPEDLFATTDVVISALPDTDETREMLRPELLNAQGSRLKLIVNVGRGTITGPTVKEEKEFADALLHWKGRYATDVTFNEMLAFRKQPYREAVLAGRAILTPHMASNVPAVRDAMGIVMVENLKAMMAGRPLPNPVPPPTAVTVGLSATEHGGSANLSGGEEGRVALTELIRKADLNVPGGSFVQKLKQGVLGPVVVLVDPQLMEPGFEDTFYTITEEIKRISDSLPLLLVRSLDLNAVTSTFKDSALDVFQLVADPQNPELYVDKGRPVVQVQRSGPIPVDILPAVVAGMLAQWEKENRPLSMIFDAIPYQSIRGLSAQDVWGVLREYFTSV